MSGPDSTPSGAERRRYARIPIKLDALVSFAGRPPIMCSVRDFCVAGMFIALKPLQLKLVSPQMTATLYFALMVDGERQEHQLSLLVCRVVGPGVGVQFDNPDPQIIGLLQSLAGPAPAEPEPAADGSTPSKPAEKHTFAPEFALVLPSLTELVSRHALHMASEFVRMAMDALFLAARDAKTNREQARFNDAQGELRKRAELIKGNIPPQLVTGVSILNDPSTPKEQGQALVALTSLSLVDKDEFEEFLTVSEVIREIEPRLKDPLFELNKRFSKLANREVDESSNPLGPTVVCNVFAESLKGMQVEREAADLIYGALRRMVEPALARLYDETNHFLVANGILPTIERDKPGFVRPPRSDHSRTAPPVSPTDAAAGPSDPLSGYGAPPPAPTGYGGPPPGYAGGYVPPPPPAYPGGMPEALPPGTMSGFPPPPGGPAPVFGYPPAGAVVPAFPSFPSLNVGAAAPMYPEGGLPPGAVAPAMPGPAVVGAGMPPGMVNAGMPPGVVGAASLLPGAVGFDASFGGFGFGPAVRAVPSLMQAYSTAQAQLALRRQLAPEYAGAGGTVAAGGAGVAGGASGVPVSGPVAHYSPAQLVDGLYDLQRSLAEAQDPVFYDVGSVKQRLVDALTRAGDEPRQIGQAESDALEIIVNLLEALLHDSQVTNFAKAQLKRLQGAVHKTALIDPNFFESTHHPVRQLLNRVSLLRENLGADPRQDAERVQTLINQVNQSYQRDLSVFEPVLAELDGILKEQRSAYDQNIAQIVNGCEEQQRVLRDRREKSGHAPGEITGPGAALPAEWSRWLNRSKALQVGDRFLMNANGPHAYPVTLVWIGEDFNPYVFSDEKGKKASTLTLQQVAMYLRRGVLKQVNETTEDGAVDRALFGIVNKIHEQVEEQATHDPLTGLLNRKTFLQMLEQRLPDASQKDVVAVLAQLSIENLKALNDKHGVESGDEMIRRVAEVLTGKFKGRPVLLGRLGGGDIGIYWDKGGLQNAYKAVHTSLEALGKLEIDCHGEVAVPKLAVGLTEVKDDLAKSDQLLATVAEACNAARATPDKPIYVAGSENEHRKHLEQMVSYVGKALQRDRLVLLCQEVRPIGGDGPPAAHIVVSAEDRNGRLVPPSLFSQASSSSEFAFEVDVWIVRRTLAWMAAHDDDLETLAAVIIPLSRASIDNEGLVTLIMDQLMETPVPPAKICFSIADRDAVAKLAETSELINTLREFGCRFVLDEFGSGHHNYEYVKELAVDFVTIQTAYVLDARQNAKDFAMAKSINELVHFMGKRTIAKQSPDADLAETLREIGVDFLHDISRTTRVAA
ncbi:MAG: DUF1631 family protein [Gammaproteobacteria bacterium]|nr:DUF1631 family protein [Gammaproteobacteria bacterium]MBI5615573.1 DUF1631 family protein [Gammaproteobacteria bacterium]